MITGVGIPSGSSSCLGSKLRERRYRELNHGALCLKLVSLFTRKETNYFIVYFLKRRKIVARNLKNLADEYEDNDDDYFEKLTHKPKYSKKTREVEIRKQRQAKERARKSSMRQYEDHFEEE